MGTRSLTIFEEEDGTEIAVMYRQMDGYPEGHGKDLAEFVEGKKVVNGIPLGAEESSLFNGANCLAASIVAHFKERVGDFYLHPAGTRSRGAEYLYYVRPVDGKVQIRMEEA